LGDNQSGFRALTFKGIFMKLVVDHVLNCQAAPPGHSEKMIRQQSDMVPVNQSEQEPRWSARVIPERFSAPFTV
jgi:hypothetical protein